MMLMSVNIGLVWFKMVLSIYYDVDVCQYWSGLVYDVFCLYIMMLMSVSIGLVWFKMVFVYILRCLCLSVLVWSSLRCFLSIYYDVDVCQYWSGLV